MTDYGFEQFGSSWERQTFAVHLLQQHVFRDARVNVNGHDDCKRKLMILGDDGMDFCAFGRAANRPTVQPNRREQIFDNRLEV